MKNKKRKQNSNKNHRINKRIRAKEVRLIDKNGTNLGIKSFFEALNMANNDGLDLVEVNSGKIPVCKILDYGKLKYQESKKEKKKEQKTQEIQFRPKIAENDFQTKLNKARKFLKKGSNVHLVVVFRGREAFHKETGDVLLDKAITSLQDVANLVKRNPLKGKRMNAILSPKSDK